MFNYLYLGSIDISNIKKILLEQNEDIWKDKCINEIRKKLDPPGYTHKDVDSINLMWNIESLSNRLIKTKKNKNYDLFEINIFLDKITPLIQKKYGKGYFNRILMTKLPKEKKIPPHMDSGDSLKNCKRIHVPIISNKKIFFIVNDEKKVMKEGELWEINNQKIHSVENNSDLDRIHLILDYNTNNFNYGYS